jgi:hypothetical protein
MITDARLAALAAATYACDPTWTGQGLEQSLHAVRSVEPDENGSTDPGLIIIAFRGSIVPHDWALDFQAVPAVDRETAQHPALGRMHRGFLLGAQTLIPQVALAVQGKRYALTGHSLGGALALVVAGLLVDDGNPPQRVTTFGAPKCGFAQFVAALEKVPIAQYRRGNDPVPLLPCWLPQFPYEHPRLPLIRVGVPAINPFQCHHVEGYVADVTAFEQQQAAK